MEPIKTIIMGAGGRDFHNFNTAYRDDPHHTGYFGKAEPHFGLVRADGTKKPAIRAFRDLGKRFGSAGR